MAKHDSQLTLSCRSSSGRCLIIHPIAQTSHPVISIFSHTSRNSCLVNVSVFRMTERWICVSHSGSNSKRQTSTTQGYKSWSHGMTNVSILEVNMLKNSSFLAVSVSVYMGFRAHQHRRSLAPIWNDFFLIIHYGRQWPEMLMGPKTLNIHIHTSYRGTNFCIPLS